MENPKENDPEYCRRKADQAWEMAGMARCDGDKEDEERHTKEARRLDAKYKELKACGS